MRYSRRITRFWTAYAFSDGVSLPSEILLKSRLGQLRSELVIITLEVEQRFALADHDIFDFSNKDCVVACILRVLQPAFQIRKRPIQHRGSVLSTLEPGFIPRVDAFRIRVML